jgi:hypothetical protein
MPSNSLSPGPQTARLRDIFEYVTFGIDRRATFRAQRKALFRPLHWRLEYDRRNRGYKLSSTSLILRLPPSTEYIILTRGYFPL